jgi:hypothetical protein
VLGGGTDAVAPGVFLGRSVSTEQLALRDRRATTER